MRERVLITGGSGFIGSCLAYDLAAEGHDVHLLLRPEHKSWRIKDLRGRHTPHSADLRDAQSVRSVVEQVRPDYVYHLGVHGAYPGQKDRSQIFDTTVGGTTNLIDAVRDMEIKGFVHAGSSSEYGAKAEPMREQDRIEPRSDYAIAKAAATHLVQAEAYKGRPFATVRVFSAFGPWEEPTRLVPYIMDCCERRVQPKVSAGDQPRDFIYVGDVIELMKTVARNPGLHGGIWNAGTGVQTTVREMIEAIAGICGNGRIQPEYGAIPAHSEEPLSWVADIAETKQKTGWKPKRTIRNGIVEMWSWHHRTVLRRAAA